MPEIRPNAGGTPDAMAMPMHRGRATRNTTSEAIISRPHFTLSVVVVVSVVVILWAHLSSTLRSAT
jgi:uncharacterized YccA/Bax inhibitor family protein